MAVQLRTGHNPEAMNEAIESACADIDFYCPQYTEQGLSQSRWVQAKATDLALYYLCAMEMNPVESSVGELYLHAIEQLKQVQSGTAMLRGVPLGRNGRPSVTGYRVNLRRNPGIQVERPRSTPPDPDGFNRRTDPISDTLT